MPRKGRQRSQRQKDQTRSLTSLRYCAQDEVGSVASATTIPSSTEEVQKLKREIARLKRDLTNGVKREKRLREKLAKGSKGGTAPAHADEESETKLEQMEVRQSDELGELDEGEEDGRGIQGLVV